MAEVPRACPHPKVKVVARWVEPDSVHEGSCFQWFQCEACGKHWRERRRVPVPQGTRLSDVKEEAAEPLPMPPVTERRARRFGDATRLQVRTRTVVIVVALQLLVLAAMLWYIFTGPLH